MTSLWCTQPCTASLPATRTWLSQTQATQQRSSRWVRGVPAACCVLVLCGQPHLGCGLLTAAQAAACLCFDLARSEPFVETKHTHCTHRHAHAHADAHAPHAARWIWSCLDGVLCLCLCAGVVCAALTASTSPHRALQSWICRPPGLGRSVLWAALSTLRGCGAVRLTLFHAARTRASPRVSRVRSCVGGANSCGRHGAAPSSRKSAGLWT